MATGSQRPGGAASNFDHWLRRCEGFRVDAPHGRVGVVEEVRYASRFDRPDVIAVRAGLLGRLLLIIPIGEIAEILPKEERIVVRRSPRPTATERLRDLRGHGRPGGRLKGGNGEVGGVAGGAKPREARREVRAVIKRLTRLIGLRFRRGGEREMTSDVEASGEPSTDEPPAEEKTAEEPEAEEAPAEQAAEAVPTEQQAAEEPKVEEQAAEEQPTA
jgi:hypothetical protein